MRSRRDTSSLALLGAAALILSVYACSSDGTSGVEPMSTTDALIDGGQIADVVDDDIDPSNISDVIWALGTRWDPANGIDVLQRTTSNIKDPLLTADQRKRNDLYTSTAIITACKPFGWIDEFPKTIKASDELIAKTKKKWGDLLNWS